MQQDNNNNNNNYNFRTNVNKPLAQILDIPEMKYDDPNVWVPPKEYGLRNSIYIIPDYYNNSNTNYFNLNYFEIIKDDIRNMRVLNNYQMEYIKQLSHNEKNELFELFNQCLVTVNDIVLT